MKTATGLALYVDSNWNVLTGEPESAKHQEGEFPETVLDLIEEHGVDYHDFCDAWTSLYG